MKVRRRGPLVLELAPVIDVIFLLLLFFLVTSVFRKDELALLLSLPKVAEAQTVTDSPATLVVEVSSKQLALQGQVLSMEGFRQKIKFLCPNAEQVQLRADGQVSFDRVAMVLSVLQRFECRNLKIRTEKRQ